MNNFIKCQTSEGIVELDVSNSTTIKHMFQDAKDNEDIINIDVSKKTIEDYNRLLTCSIDCNNNNSKKDKTTFQIIKNNNSSITNKDMCALILDKYRNSANKVQFTELPKSYINYKIANKKNIEHCNEDLVSILREHYQKIENYNIEDWCMATDIDWVLRTCAAIVKDRNRYLCNENKGTFTYMIRKLFKLIEIIHNNPLHMKPEHAILVNSDASKLLDLASFLQNDTAREVIAKYITKVNIRTFIKMYFTDSFECEKMQEKVLSSMWFKSNSTVVDFMTLYRVVDDIKNSDYIKNIPFIITKVNAAQYKMEFELITYNSDNDNEYYL